MCVKHVADAMETYVDLLAISVPEIWIDNGKRWLRPDYVAKTTETRSP